MTIFRKNIDLTGVYIQSVPIFGRTDKGLGRTLKSLSAGLKDQPAFDTDLSVTSWPKIIVTMQTLDPDLYGLLAIGDVGFLATVDIGPQSMVMDAGGVHHGVVPTLVINNFKDIKTVDPVFLAIGNYMGPMVLSVMIEYGQIVITDTEATKVILGVDR